MTIPCRKECLLILEQVRMPIHIQRHSLMVAEIALFLGRLLSQNGTAINMEILEAGALLHDIAKPRSILTGERHNEVGAGMVREMGYEQLATIVVEHVTIDDARLKGPITESILVNYADKRVMHDQVVSLQERFRDLVHRYGKTTEKRELIQSRLSMYLRLERKLFSHIQLNPTGMELMCISVDSKEGEQDDRRQDYGRIAGRRDFR